MRIDVRLVRYLSGLGIEAGVEPPLYVRGRAYQDTAREAPVRLSVSGVGAIGGRRTEARRRLASAWQSSVFVGVSL